METNTSLVPRGSVVRVFNFLTMLGGTVTVKVGSTNISVVALQKMSEFLFYVDTSGNGRWLLVQGNATSGRI